MLDIPTCNIVGEKSLLLTYFTRKWYWTYKDSDSTLMINWLIFANLSLVHSTWVNKILLILDNRRQQRNTQPKIKGVGNLTCEAIWWTYVWYHSIIIVLLSLSVANANCMIDLLFTCMIYSHNMHEVLKAILGVVHM